LPHGSTTNERLQFGTTGSTRNGSPSATNGAPAQRNALTERNPPQQRTGIGTLLGSVATRFNDERSPSIRDDRFNPERLTVATNGASAQRNASPNEILLSNESA
jgi:hypothetical protein